jgi:hypothetical protein
MLRAACILLIVLSGAAFFTFLQTRQDMHRLSVAVERLTLVLDRIETEIRPVEAGYLYHTHYSAPLPGTTAPVRRDVTTKRNAGESAADWMARHADAVAASLAAYPPV